MSLSHVNERPYVAAEVRRSVPVRLLSSSTLHGINRYHSATVICQEYDLGRFATSSTAMLDDGFAERFEERFLALPTLLPIRFRPADFSHRLQSFHGVPALEALFEAILSVEACAISARHCLTQTTYAEILPGETRNTIRLVWETRYPVTSKRAAAAALIGFNDILTADTGGDRSRAFDKALAALIKDARGKRLSPTTAVVMRAAHQRDIPVKFLGNSYLRLGHGAAQRRICASTSDATSYAAARLSINKRRTNLRLSELGLPVPRQFRVRSLKEAEAAAGQLGFPVVLKPTKGRMGGGVTVDIRTFKEVRSAYRNIGGRSPDAIIETFLPGQDYRLLVIGGRFVAALTRVPPSVTGDGRSTIAKLIDRLNDDPFRDGFRMFPLVVDDEVSQTLNHQGYGLGDVLEAGKSIPLRTVANVSIGGSPVDITDQVHPDNKAMAVRAAQAVGLDVAGIDFVTTDITRSYRDVSGGVIEVNARPGLCMHTWPRHGTPRDVGGAMLDMIYDAKGSSRLTTMLVLGDKRTAVIARDLDERLRARAVSVGLVIRNTAFLNARRCEFSADEKRKAARLLMLQPDVEALITTMSPAGALRRGLQVDRLDVAVIADPIDGADAEEYKAAVEVVARSGARRIIVASDNAMARTVLAAAPVSSIVLITNRGKTAVLNKHIADGGSAAWIEWHNGQRRIAYRRAGGTIERLPFSPARENPNDTADAPSTGRQSGKSIISLFAAIAAHEQDE